MFNRRGLRAVYSTVLAIAAPASVGLWVQGCNMEQPPKTQVNDSQITTQVKSKLAADVGPATVTNITVNTTNGVVTLAGQVESPEVKQHAETVTASVPGVVHVNNELQVASAAATTGQ